jgi:hypothetical protein
MTLREAKILCSNQTTGAAWDFIRDDAQSFIWSDDEEPVVTWNIQFGKASGSVTEEWISGREDLLVLSFGGRTAEVAFEFNRVDRFRLLHGLAKVTRPELDLRLCKDSTHSSDVAFLAMPLDDWKSLESEFGANTVASRFHSMDSSFDQFIESAFPRPDLPKETLSSELTDWEGGSSYHPSKLEYKLVNDGPGQPRLDVLRGLIYRYLEPGTVTVSVWRSPTKLNVERDALLAAVTGRIGEAQIRVSNSMQTGFLVVEPNGVAAGWRTDGWEPANEAPSPAKWWKLWKRPDTDH